jgi:hypothetical protein
MQSNKKRNKTKSLFFVLLPLLLLLLAAPAAPAQLRITGDTKVREHTIARLTAEGAADAALIWDVDQEDKVDAIEWGSSLFFVGPPGSYRIKCRAIRVKDGRPIAETARATVVIEAASPPPPPPPPGPTPPPPPPPPPTPVVVKTLWILVVEETAEASANRGEFFANRELIDRIRAKGHRYRVADKDVKDKDGRQPADLAPWLKRAAGKSLPQLFLISQDGDILFEGPLPKTPAELVALMVKVGG